jgi:hypothetical protein
MKGVMKGLRIIPLSFRDILSFGFYNSMRPVPNFTKSGHALGFLPLFEMWRVIDLTRSSIGNPLLHETSIIDCDITHAMWVLTVLPPSWRPGEGIRMIDSRMPGGGFSAASAFFRR